jgi:hypothetical protein
MSELGGGFDIYAHLRERPNPGAYCPHCNGVGGVEPHHELVLVCRICGAPRINMPDGMTVDAVALGQLKKVDKLRKKRGFLAGLGVVGGVSAAFGLFVTLLVFLIGTLGWSMLPMIMFVAPSVAAVLYARNGRKAATKEIASSLDAAWLSAAGELVRAGKVQSANDLAKVTGADAVKAQQLWTMLSVEAEIGNPQVRIDAGPVVAQVPADARFAELEARERQAEAEASAAVEDARAKGRTN